MESTKVLIIDDDPRVGISLHRVLKEAGYEPLISHEEQKGISLFKKHRPAVVLLDLRLAEGESLGLLKLMKEMNSSVAVIVLTAYGSISTAVKAMKLGAYDYLTKPVESEKVKITIRNALERHQLLENVDRLKQSQKFKPDSIATASPVMQKIMKMVKQVASYNVTVLVQGETGTGKELIAKMIHYQSQRSDQLFIPIDCTVLPGGLIESELFGFEKGAFTSADTRKMGKFELAQRGTAFLDEIGNMPVHTQAKLLRVLQERKIDRLGGTTSIPLDIRVIAATNTNLKEATKAGQFREDLYYRLAEFEIHVPPLRERKEDIDLLSQGFLEEFNQLFNKQLHGFESDALEALRHYRWPGNVRELKSAVKMAVLFAPGPLVSLKYFPPPIQRTAHEPVCQPPFSE